MTISHLISECDRVLVDSEAIALQALADFLAPIVGDRERLLPLHRVDLFV